MENRRSFFGKTLAALGALALVGKASAAPAAGGKQKVAYHLSEMEKVGFVIGNIRNHIKGMGGPEKVDIQLVVHGPALKAFHKVRAKSGLQDALDELKAEGVGLHACGNTMRAQKIDLPGLLLGFVRRDEGGVVVLATLQQQGYVYLRP
jgi:uncharacterized protein